MFERFSDRARRVLILANAYAREGGRVEVSAAHVLLGLAREGEGVAGRVLIEDLGVDPDRLAEEVGKALPSAPDDVPSGHLPFDAGARKALELSLREALQLGHTYIGTEHILLGVSRDGEIIGCGWIPGHDALRRAVVKRLGSPDPPPTPTTPAAIETLLTERDKIEAQIDELRARRREFNVAIDQLENSRKPRP